MSLKEDIIDGIRGQSIAKYATWYYFRPERILLDAGEGVSSVLRNMVFGIESVFITHGHYDHIGGIPGLIRSRVTSRGDQSKSLTIYHPPRCTGLEQVKHYLAETSWKLPFELVWAEMDPGESVPLPGESKNRRIEAFEVVHSPGKMCFGYKIVETRRRLKPKYQGLFKEEIIRIKKEHGPDELTENYDQILLCFSGDCMPLDPALAKGAEVLMHDATFVNTEDREEEFHATVREAVESAQAAEVQSLVLYHFSTRYQKVEILKEIEKATRETEVQFPVYYSNPYSLPNTRLRGMDGSPSNVKNRGGDGL